MMVLCSVVVTVALESSRSRGSNPTHIT
jgi:hypothetical protein